MTNANTYPNTQASPTRWLQPGRRSGTASPDRTTRPTGDSEVPAVQFSHVLVVDDDLGTVEQLGRLLKGFARISFATNGEDALRLAAQQQPDLVLLDVELPGMGGFEVFRRLRAMPGLRGLPIVFATSHVDADTEARALQLGADDFLRKPFDDTQVRARVHTQLRTAATRAGEPEPATACSARVLIVDDDPVSIQLVRRLLAEIAECHFALNGTQALGLAEDLRPDLVLLDIDLPDGDGYDVCRKLRANPVLGQVPILFLSQSDTAGHEARALALGGDDFVRKPFNPTALRARARRLVDRSLARRHKPGGAGRASNVSMLSYIAHEIGNPVNVINGFAQLLRAEPLSPRQADMLSHILDATNRLSGLMADMGDVARLQSGQFTVRLVDVELHHLARQACEQARIHVGEADVQLIAPPAAPPVHVRADERRLRQCLDNLLSNAIKYGGDGRCIDISIEVRGAEVALSVQDQGVGLSEEQLAHLFEPYNRLGRSAGSIPGTGLGLLLTRDLVQAMDGRLEVHSRRNEGCRFELLLRASDPPNAPA